MIIPFSFSLLLSFCLSLSNETISLKFEHPDLFQLSILNRGLFYPPGILTSCIDKILTRAWQDKLTSSQDSFAYHNWGCVSTGCLGFPRGSDSKASACNVGDPGSIPGRGKSPGEGNGNPLQNSCLQNPMDGGAWKATVDGVAQRRTRLSN